MLTIPILPILRHQSRLFSIGTAGRSQSLSTCCLLSLVSCNKPKVVGVHHLPQGACILQQDHHLPPPKSSCPILVWWNNVEPRNIIPFFLLEPTTFVSWSACQLCSNCGGSFVNHEAGMFYSSLKHEFGYWGNATNMLTNTLCLGC